MLACEGTTVLWIYILAVIILIECLYIVIQCTLHCGHVIQAGIPFTREVTSDSSVAFL